MSSSQSLRPSTAQGARFDDKPLWNHVQVVNVADGGGGNRIWVCIYCSKRVVGSYTKVKGHLLRLPHHNVEGCLSISNEVLEAIRKEHEAAEAKKAQLALNVRKKAEYVTIPEGSDLLQQKKRKGMATGDALTDAFNVAQRDVADKDCARMFYASGLAFNLARFPIFRNLIKQVQDIRNFVLNHGKANYIFNHYSNLKLLSVVETRFASSFIMAKHLREVKTSLEKMVMDASWKIYRAYGNTLTETKAREVKKCIVDDTFWDQLDYLLSFIETIIDMLRIADTDSPVLHLIYDMWDTMIENVKKRISEHEGEDMEFGGDQFDIEGQEVAELAQLSLDEPELERMTFQDVEAGEVVRGQITEAGFTVYIAKKPKPKMKPIELKTPPEQTQTITRVIFDVLKEQGPLTITDTWERLKEVGVRGLTGKRHMKTILDEGEAETWANLQPRRSPQAISVYNVVHQTQYQAGKARKCFFSTETPMIFMDY
ncbi:hypothetical protein RHGRI_023582 [Rhododendron griersonianum]|uniref:DUF659 domain-containing protein n=1 Tax=Rhododendron griersonianum TaxID=479676 RepID=A0AAV6J9K0_9ERIC|nr:hypothetical protein RHGRI_023582 [Rhododendron griersonianum]